MDPDTDTTKQQRDQRAEPADGPNDAAAAERPRLQVSGNQVVAGTLASVSAAAVASVFGTAGTITGTAVGSVVTTVGAAVYSTGLRHTSAKLRQTGAVVPVPPIRPAPPRTRLDRGRRWLRQRHWGVATGLALVFVLALAMVTLIELAGQRPLSAIAHGDTSGTTSIGKVVRSDTDDGSDDAPDDGTTSSTAGSTAPTTTPAGDGGEVTDGDPQGDDVQGGEGPSSTGSTSTPAPGAGEGPATTAPEPPDPGDQSTPPSAG